MRTSAVLMIALLICSTIILSESQKRTNVPCNNSRPCVPVCIREVNNKNGKCSNGKCLCYP
uniref:Putative potassium channel toxin Tx753 n=1 Tax=Buthus israelis TaxID=2899555 RepID=B8XH43_BUTIS|nr:putative potassium channel toxin Tx753 [Buthus occitanus israelis]